MTAEYDDEWYGTDDLSLFFQRNSLPNNTGTVQLIGYNDPTSDGGEADLDIRRLPDFSLPRNCVTDSLLEYLMGMGVNVPTWFISLDKSLGDPFLEWIMLMLYLGDEAPLLHSTSYGSDEHFLSDLYLARVVNDLKKFGATGHTIFFRYGNCPSPLLFATYSL